MFGARSLEEHLHLILNAIFLETCKWFAMLKEVPGCSHIYERRQRSKFTATSHLEIYPQLRWLRTDLQGMYLLAWGGSKETYMSFPCEWCFVMIAGKINFHSSHQSMSTMGASKIFVSVFHGNLLSLATLIWKHVFPAYALVFFPGCTGYSA